jgi:hypothetical protein
MYKTDQERQLREARKHGRQTQVRQLVAQGVGANLKKTRTKKKAAKKTAAKKTTSAPQTPSSSDNT